MKKGKNMINQKNDLNMITRKLETELSSFHFDGLEISEITTTTSWMKLYINVLFIRDDVQITKVLYKDYETGLWYYIKDNGMIISHKDTFNHTIKNLLDEMIYDANIEIEEIEKTEEITAIEDLERDLDEIAENENLDEYEEISDRNKINFPTISELYNDKCFCCTADRAGNRCCGEKWCAETWKRYEAIIKPEWHHVSLSTIANLDFDMLDEKRQRYLTVYRELQETLSRLRKCKSLESYDNCLRRFKRMKNVMWARGEISNEMWHYIESKLSMQNVESGVWTSYNEKATGYHKSRRYNKNRA